LCLTTWLRRPEGNDKDAETRRWGDAGKCIIVNAVRPPRLRVTPSPRLSFAFKIGNRWSGRRDLNSRPSPWQGDALPLSYSRLEQTDSSDSSWLVKRGRSTK